MPQRPTFVILDGNSLLYRAFHSMPPLTTKNGAPIGAVYGFTSMLLKIAEQFSPQYMAATFDLKGPTFRHAIYKEYKAHRPPMPQELVEQIDSVKKMVEAFHIPIFELQGYEADDLIGTMSKKIPKQIKNTHVIIVSGDLDGLQLVDDSISLFTSKKSFNDTAIYNEQAVKDRYNGLSPSQMIDYKALRGDPSDNIPGIVGIGEKTAIELLKKYKTLDHIFQKSSELELRMLKKINNQQAKESAYLSKRLVTINREVPINFQPKDCSFNPNPQNILKIFQEYEFQSLIQRMKKLSKGIKDIPELSNTKGQKPKKDEFSNLFEETNQAKIKTFVIQNEKDLQKLVQESKQKPAIAFDTETTGLNAQKARLIGVSLSFDGETAYYLPYDQIKVNKEIIVNKLNYLFAQKNQVIIGHNLKYDLKILQNINVVVNGKIFDTMVAAFMLQGGQTERIGLKSLGFLHFGVVMKEFKEVLESATGNPKKIENVALDTLSQYAGADAAVTFKLFKLYQKLFQSKRQEENLFSDIEMPLLQLLLQMESHGMLIHRARLIEYQKKVNKLIQDTEKSIFQISQKHFNINSSQQLGKILFDQLGLTSSKKTKTQRSTDESVLRELEGTHPIIKQILIYRELAKLNSTYIEGLKPHIDQNGRVHTSFSQSIASTGRLSSSNPNLQNIPVGQTSGINIRSLFIAPYGYSILSVDYSQIELRIMAHLSNDPELIQTFKQGKDVHSSSAALIFNIPHQQVTPEQRRLAKIVNFGILYGMGAHGLSKQLGIPYTQAQDYIDQYFAKYAGVAEYINNLKQKAVLDGFAKTLFGRTRKIPELKSSNKMIQRAGERMAVNLPIQGTQADIIKKAMVELWPKIEAYKVKKNRPYLISQVHDELVFEVPNNLLHSFSAMVKKTMENVVKLQVPLIVDLAAGQSWGELRKLKPSKSQDKTSTKQGKKIIQLRQKVKKS